MPSSAAFSLGEIGTTGFRLDSVLYPLQAVNRVRKGKTGMTSTRAMMRAKRAAHALHRGNEILDFLGQRAVRASLIAAAEAGVPPLAAISERLKAKIGEEITSLPVRSFVGICVRAILEEEGFEVAEKGVRISGDPVFRVGSVYRRVNAVAAHPKAGNIKVLKAVLDALDEAEIDFAMNYLRKRSSKIPASKR